MLKKVVSVQTILTSLPSLAGGSENRGIQGRAKVLLSSCCHPSGKGFSLYLIAFVIKTYWLLSESCFD